MYIISGELTPVTDAGKLVMRAGDSAVFKAGVADGHHPQNRSQALAVMLAVGTRRTAGDEANYSDIDLQALKGRAGYAHRDGMPYPAASQKS